MPLEMKYHHRAPATCLRHEQEKWVGGRSPAQLQEQSKRNRGVACSVTCYSHRSPETVLTVSHVWLHHGAGGREMKLNTFTIPFFSDNGSGIQMNVS